MKTVVTAQLLYSLHVREVRKTESRCKYSVWLYQVCKGTRYFPLTNSTVLLSAWEAPLPQCSSGFSWSLACSWFCTVVYRPLSIRGHQRKQGEESLGIYPWAVNMASSEPDDLSLTEGQGSYMRSTISFFFFFLRSSNIEPCRHWEGSRTHFRQLHGTEPSSTVSSSPMHLY